MLDLICQYTNYQEQAIIKKVFDYFLSKDKDYYIGLENVRKLDITVWMEHMQDCHGWIENDPDDKRKFNIYLAQNYDTLRDLIGTMAHELVHVKQWIYPSPHCRTEAQTESEANYYAERICEEMWEKNLI